MQTSTALFNRPDTLFGVCEGIGQEFGFNPLYLRVTLAVMLLWNPIVPLAIYATLGGGVMLSRWLAPARAPRTHRAVGAGLNAVPSTAPGENDEASVAIAA